MHPLLYSEIAEKFLEQFWSNFLPMRWQIFSNYQGSRPLYYIMPPMPPAGIGGIAGFSSGRSPTMASVVRTRAAMLAAF